jgi:hypothetical protein
MFGNLIRLCHTEKLLLFAQLTSLYDQMTRPLCSSLITRPSLLV